MNKLLKFFRRKELINTSDEPKAYENIIVNPRIRELNINFTSKCLLKCTYCSAGKEGYQGFDISVENADLIYEFIKTNNVKSVVFGFYGDTLESEIWSSYANKILDLGVTCRMHTALYRQLSNDEIKALSRFSTIATSCDTSDRQKQALIRKGLDLRTLIYNIIHIRAYALERDLTPPIFEINCVFTDNVSEDLCSLVSFAHSLGISVVSVSDFCDFEDFETPYNSVLSLEISRIKDIYNHVLDAQKLANKLKLKLDFQFLDSLKEACNGKKTSKQDPFASNMYGNVSFYANTLKSDETRLCIKPWDNFSITPQGEIFPCCTFGSSLGNLTSSQSISDTFFGENFNQLRESLLTAKNIPIYCKNCQAAPACSKEELISVLQIATVN